MAAASDSKTRIAALREQIKKFAAAGVAVKEGKDTKTAAAPAVGGGTKLHDYEVELVPSILGKGKTPPPRGEKLFQTAFANIFLVAPKNVGKTTVVWNIIKECCSPATVIYLFCSTLNHDQSWVSILKQLEQKDINVVKYTAIEEGGVHHLKALIDEMIAEGEESSSESDEELVYEDDDGTEQPEGKWQKPKKQKKKKPKFTEIERLFIFDDIGKKALNSASLAQLLKTNRHFKSKVLVSTQYVKDTPPDARKNFDYVLLFPHLTSTVIDVILEASGLSFGGKDEKEDAKMMLELYQKNATVEHNVDGTTKKVNFLYVDVKRMKFRRNFNFELQVKVVGNAPTTVS